MKQAPSQPSLWEPPPPDCPTCEGTGRLRDRDTGEWIPCRNCGGTGHVTIPY